MKGINHVYECQVQVDQKLCVCAMYKPCGCKRCEPFKNSPIKDGRIELIQNGPTFTKHKVIYDKVNEIINYLNKNHGKES